MVRFSEIQQFPDFLELFPGNFRTICPRFENFEIFGRMVSAPGEERVVWYSLDCVVMWNYNFNFKNGTTIICMHFRVGYAENNNGGFYDLIPLLLPPRRREGHYQKTLGTKFKKNNNTMTYCFCFPDLRNQGDVDETRTQLSLAMVIVLCVASLVAVAIICGTIAIVVMYKRWSAKHEARPYHRRLEPRNLRSLKYKYKEKFPPLSMQ